ncbi:hypothetical protein [Streptomyces sp. NPDC050485]|uniref:hypothetical protein n=1 Tax=Streptomyces sp. NPDC050485 TaxID=3365617 RepID=UPI00378BA459
MDQRLGGFVGGCGDVLHVVGELPPGVGDVAQLAHVAGGPPDTGDVGDDLPDLVTGTH